MTTERPPPERRRLSPAAPRISEVRHELVARIDPLLDHLGGHCVLAGSRRGPQGPQLHPLFPPQPGVLPALSDPGLRRQGPETPGVKPCLLASASRKSAGT